MVCPRCIAAVTQTFAEAGIKPDAVTLGEVHMDIPPTSVQLTQIDQALKKLGFELLNPGKAAIIAQIKAAVVQQVHYETTPLQVNLSTFLSDKLHQEYSTLSRMFSAVEGITIEKYFLSQKIEKVKELLRYDELTLSQIALQLDYSSVAHLSSQFKKETGMTPTAFKKESKANRKMLDEL